MSDRLVNAIAYALARADLPIPTETSRCYAVRLAPLVIESGWLAAPPPLYGLTAERLKEVPTVKALTRRLGTFNEAWWKRFADEILAALRNEGETT